MKTSANRGRSLAFCTALAVVAAGIVVAAGSAVAAGSPAVAYRLTATLTPGQMVPAVHAPTGAVGHFHGYLIKSGVGVAAVASRLGCTVTKAPPAGGIANRIDCGGSTGTVPTAPGQWRLIWHLSVAHLGSPVISTAIGVAPVGHAAATPLMTVCGPCHTAARGFRALSSGQADALVSNSAYVQVATAAHPGGEIRGQIVRTTVPAFQAGR